MHFDFAQCKQKGFVPILILVGVLVIIGIAGGAYYFGKSQIQKPQTPSLVITSPTPQATPSDETANWKIYTGKYFTFKYPMSWKLDSNQDISASLSTTRSTLKQSTGDYTPGMAWLTFDITDDSVQKAINSVAGVEKKEQINIDNVSGTKIIGRSGVAGSVYFVTLIMSHKNGSLRVNLSTQDSDLEVPLTLELAKILSTFKFTDQNQIGEEMTIKGRILDSNSQSFDNPDLTITSVNTVNKCNADATGNFICNAILIKGKTYGVYLSNKKDNSGFILQYFEGDPGKSIDLGVKIAPWSK